MAHDVIVETRKLTKIYRDFWGRQKKTALRALNIEIRAGEIFGLLGPNGSGKTTTIKLLLGLLFPTDGEAFVFGKPAADVHKNERIGYLPEESYLYRFLNAEETLDFYGRLFNLPPGKRQERAQELIEKVNLKADRKRMLREYSKGMRQRIGLRASGLQLTDQLRRDLEEVLRKHGGAIDTIGHPTTTLEDYFLRIVEESKAHPGRRFLPGGDRVTDLASGSVGTAPAGSAG